VVRAVLPRPRSLVPRPRSLWLARYRARSAHAGESVSQQLELSLFSAGARQGPRAARTQVRTRPPHTHTPRLVAVLLSGFCACGGTPALLTACLLFISTSCVHARACACMCVRALVWAYARVHVRTRARACLCVRVRAGQERTGGAQAGAHCAAKSPGGNCQEVVLAQQSHLLAQQSYLRRMRRIRRMRRMQHLRWHWPRWRGAWHLHAGAIKLSGGQVSRSGLGIACR